MGIEGTTYACESENIDTREEYINFFENHKEWLIEFTESKTYLVRQMARFILKELEE